MTLSVVISAGNDRVSLKRLIASVESQSLRVEVLIENNPDYPNRANGFARANSDLVFFLDADCELPNQNFFANVIRFFEKNKSTQVVGGLYLSAAKAKTLARSYNKMCNTWVHLGESQNLLGGVFCIRKSCLGAWPISENFWGGEDTLLFRALHRQGLKLQVEPSFSVIHHDVASFRKLFRRAWAHGKMRELKSLQTSARIAKVWHRKRHLVSDFSLTEMGYLILHFVLVEISGLLTRPKSSPAK